MQAEEQPADDSSQRSKAAAKRARKKAAKQLHKAGTGSDQQLVDSTAQHSVAEPDTMQERIHTQRHATGRCSDFSGTSSVTNRSNQRQRGPGRCRPAAAAIGGACCPCISAARLMVLVVLHAE